MSRSHDFWLFCATLCIALNCIRYNAVAHMRSYAAGDYRPTYDYNNVNNQRQEAIAPQRTRQQSYSNRMNANFARAEAESQVQGQQQSQREGQGQFRGRTDETVCDKQHKRRIWVPIESVEKYELAETIQPNQNNREAYIIVCCVGYAPLKWRGQIRCRPVCESCPNGVCRAPGECECYEEYVKNDNGDCVFTCPLGCLNGRCYLDGSCQCEAGYKLDETRKFCRPICSQGCGTNARHNCTEPEICGCAKGFQLTDDGCQPVCQPDCGVGGVCRENNECDCGAGYTLKDGICQSDCYQKCDNGICVSRNRCICNPGFSYHERSTQCVPA